MSFTAAGREKEKFLRGYLTVKAALLYNTTIVKIFIVG